MLVISERDEARPDQRIWGSPSWLSPERREAVDWVTLARFLGWGCVVGHATDAALNLEAGKPRVIIVACDPELVSEKLKAALLSTLQAENVLVLARAEKLENRGRSLRAVMPRRSAMGAYWNGLDLAQARDGTRAAFSGPSGSIVMRTSHRGLRSMSSTIVAARQIGRGTVSHAWSPPQ